MKRFLIILFSVLCLMTFSVFAEGDIGSHSYSYTADAPVVPVHEVFLSVYDASPADIEITGTNAHFLFYYENVYRNTEKWVDFSSKVDVVGSPALPQPLSDALSGKNIVLLDFRDGDIYPGTAAITLNTGLSGTHCALYEYTEADGAPILTPAAVPLTPSDDGTVSLALTEAHDFLLIAEPDDALLSSLSVFVPDVTLQKDSDSGDILRTVIIAAVIALAFAAVIYFITLRILKAKRRKAKEASAGKRK